MIHGEVSGFQSRYEQYQTGTGPRFMYVWSFRIEQVDPTGAPMPRASVEMRGTSFLGSIANGDVLEIDAPFQRGVLVQPKFVQNLTAGAYVEAKGEAWARTSNLRSCLLFVVVVIAMVTFFFLFSGIMGHR